MSGNGLVLVVDDDDAIREFVRDALEFDGYSVVTAPDGAAALAVLERMEPDLVLLDMRMPVLDGWEFSRLYRAGGGRAPVVVMTAAENAEGWRAEVGGEACLPKPFMLDELFDVVGQYCAKSARPVESAPAVCLGAAS
jgi:two-component system chemotaxis response regulator CheY